MSKRFTETEKWKDSWFRGLSPELKSIWEYLRDNCDLAGFWKVDHSYMAYHINSGNIESLEEILGILNEGKQRVKDHGDYWELLDFISFQYGTLSEDCKAHKPVFNLLKKYEFKGYRKGINTLQEKDKEKEKEIKGGVGEFFENRFWPNYPKKRSKEQARKAIFAIKPSEQLQDRMMSALERAKTSAEWKKDGGQYIPHPATWLRAHGWEDEVYESPQSKDDEVLRKLGVR